MPDRQIVPPVIHGLSRSVMGTANNAAGFADDHAFGCSNDPIRIAPQAHRSIGEGYRNAVAVALQMHEAVGETRLGFDKAVKRTGNRQESPFLLGPDAGNGAAAQALDRGWLLERRCGWQAGNKKNLSKRVNFFV